MSFNKSNTGNIFSDRCPNIFVKMVRLRSSGINEDRVVKNTINRSSNPASSGRKNAKENNETKLGKVAKPSSQILSVVHPVESNKKSRVVNKKKNKIDNKTVAKSLCGAAVSEEIKTKNIKENVQNADKSTNIRRSTRISLIIDNNSQKERNNLTKGSVLETESTTGSIKGKNIKKINEKNSVDTKNVKTNISPKKSTILTKNVKSPTKVVKREAKISKKSSNDSLNDNKNKAKRSPGRPSKSLNIPNSSTNTEIDHEPIEKTAKTKNKLSHKFKNCEIDKNIPSTSSNRLRGKNQLIDNAVLDNKKSENNTPEKSADRKQKQNNKTKTDRQKSLRRSRNSLNDSKSSSSEKNEHNPVEDKEIVEITSEVDDSLIDVPKSNQIEKPLQTVSSKRLRSHKIVNYRESSINSSNKLTTETLTKSTEHTATNTQDKIPVYKQKAAEVEAELRDQSAKDLYEFEVNESETNVLNKKTKQKKKQHNRAATKNKRLKKPVKKLPPIIPITKKYDDTINKIVKVVMQKVNLRKSGEELKKTVQNLPQCKETDITSCSKNQENNASERIEDIQNDLQSANVSHGNDNPNRINILSNDVVNEAQDLNTFDLSNTPETPWRFHSDILSRNPYFLKLKKSALPALNQEMILDHTFVESYPELNTNSKTKDVPSTEAGSPIQKSILEYVTVHKSVEMPQVDDITCSFYDSHKLSPLKVRNENTVTPSKVTKRRLLLENDNISTPIQKKMKVSTMPSPDLSIIQQLDDAIDEIEHSHSDCDKENIQKENEITFFGFDSSNEENLVNKENPNSLTKPFRFSLPMKKYAAKEAIEKRLPNADSSSDSDDEDGEKDKADEQTNVQTDVPTLFEDPIDNRKRTKRKQTADALKTDQAVKKRKKDAMTKAEEEEFNKWAESFNAMCEEVEKYPLEIE